MAAFVAEYDDERPDGVTTDASLSLASARETSPLPRNIEQHRFDDEGLRAFLDGYAAVDMKSLQRVMDSHVLRGIPKQDLAANASDIELMTGCMEVLASADAAYAISSNWSTDMLDAALNAGHFSDHERRCASIAVITNDLEMDADAVTTGKITLRVQSPRDKAEWIKRIRVDALSPPLDEDDVHDKRQPLIVFVGDSANDLLAMVEADVGISLTSAVDSYFYKVAARYGVTLESTALGRSRSLEEIVRHSQEAKAQGKRVLFTATNWQEIGEALLDAQQ